MVYLSTFHLVLIVLGVFAGFFLVALRVRRQSARLDTVERGLRQQIAALQARLDRTPDATVADPAPEPRQPASDGSADVTSRPEPASAPAALAATGDANPWTRAQAPSGPETAGPSPLPPPGEKASEQVSNGADAPRHPPAFVFTEGRAAALGRWLGDNWFLAVAALSLVLAAVFLVQYGVENGLLTPFWRVMGAASLGGALIAAGEVIRRRAGDAEGATAHMPSTFSGAGTVALFVAILSARHLYAMIGAEMALALLVAVVLVALVLGWFYGSFLTAVGLIGATSAPFLVGGSSDRPEMFYVYFALLAGLGLGIDALRRWAWISVLALGLAQAGAAMLWTSGAEPAGWLGFALAVALATVAIPPLSLTPRHAGPMLLDLLRRKPGLGWPDFPNRLAWGGFALAGAIAYAVASDAAQPLTVWLALGLLAALYLAVTVWMHRAAGLDDLVLVPALVLPIVLFDQAAGYKALFAPFRAAIAADPEVATPMTALILAAAVALAGLLAAMRALRSADHAVAWAGLAAVLPLGTLAVLEAFWRPALVNGDMTWALAIIVNAGIMVMAAGWLRRGLPDTTVAMAWPVLSALTLISLALVVILSAAALTVALAVMVLVAVALDRWLNLREMVWFVHAGVAVIGTRLILWPGVLWAFDARLFDLWLAYGGVLALLAAAWALARGHDRPRGRVLLDGAIATIGAVFLTVLPGRWLNTSQGEAFLLPLLGMVWMLSALVQLYRRNAGAGAPKVRLALALLFGAVAGLAFAADLVLTNPIFGAFPSRVIGPVLGNSLLVSYGLPAIFLVAAARIIPDLRLLVFRLLTGLGATFAAFTIAAEIRHLWQGADIRLSRGTGQGELYSYTIAMLLASVLLLALAFTSRSVMLRRGAVIGIGLVIAKVFLIDMAGLSGLIRVASFLGLGLSLAGLAWVDRLMTRAWHSPGPSPDTSPDTPPDTPPETSVGPRPDQPG